MLDKIQNDLKEAQLSRDETKVSTLRLLLAEIKNAEISKGDKLSDEEIIHIIQREVKKRKEAAEGFRGGSREQQAQKEEEESKILEAYLPLQFGIEELTKIVEDSISELGTSSLQDMGKIIRLVLDKVKSRADGGTVSALVRERLS